MHSISLSLSLYIYIYIYVWGTASSHNFKSQHFELRVSNRRTIAYLRFKMPFESSDLRGPERTFPDRAFENWLHACKACTADPS